MKGHDFQGTPVPVGTSLLLSRPESNPIPTPPHPRETPPPRAPLPPRVCCLSPGGPHLLGRLGDRGHEGVFLRVLHLLGLLQLVPCGSVWHGRHAGGKGGRKGADRPGRRSGRGGRALQPASLSRAPRPRSTIAESAAAALRQGAGPGQHLRQHAPAGSPTRALRLRAREAVTQRAGRRVSAAPPGGTCAPPLLSGNLEVLLFRPTKKRKEKETAKCSTSRSRNTFNKAKNEERGQKCPN